MQTTLKFPLSKVVKHAATTALINDIVGPANRLVGLTYLVLRLYLMNLLNQNLEEPPVDEPLVRYAMWAVKRENPGHPAHTDMPIRQQLVDLIPGELRHTVILPTGSSQIMTLERVKMVTCMNVAVQESFISNRRCFVNRSLKQGRYKLNKDMMIIIFYIILIQLFISSSSNYY
jgi:hypothetical protein